MTRWFLAVKHFALLGCFLRCLLAASVGEVGDMQIGYGSYLSQLNEAGLVIQREDVTSEATGLLVGVKEQWTVNGFLQAADPYKLTAMISALELAFSVNYAPATLLSNQGVVLRQLVGVTILGGTRVVSGPSYPNDGTTDAEYSTYRRYQVIIEGRFAPPGGVNPGNATVFWQQTIQQIGTGGPRFVYRQPLLGPPQKQMTAQFTPVRIIQRGHAIGLTQYPLAPDPLWPDDEHLDSREIEHGTPERQGNVYVNWPIDWTYVYEGLTLDQQLNLLPYPGS